VADAERAALEEAYLETWTQFLISGAVGDESGSYGDGRYFGREFYEAVVVPLREATPDDFRRRHELRERAIDAVCR
jgi:hypothetical protein